MSTAPTTDQMLAEAIAALQAIAAGLDGTRNRFGKLEAFTTDCEPLRALRMHYATGPCQDNIEGAVHVARAVLARTMLGVCARVDASPSRF